MFGYVITNNNVGSEAGFWSPFPRLVVKLSDIRNYYFGKIDSRGNYRWSWDWWSYREEIAHRRMMRAGEQYASHPEYMTF